METSTIIWVIVAVVVVVAIVAFVVSRSSARRADSRRAEAAELRETAVEHDRRLREGEAEAAEANARAELARAEAQKRELDAERLATEAQSRSQSAAAVRQERDEQLRLADLRDPDVSTDKEGNRLDERGDRIHSADLGSGADDVHGTGADDRTTDGHHVAHDSSVGSDDDHRNGTA